MFDPKLHHVVEKSIGDRISLAFFTPSRLLALDHTRWSESRNWNSMQLIRENSLRVVTGLVWRYVSGDKLGMAKNSSFVSPLARASLSVHLLVHPHGKKGWGGRSIRPPRNFGDRAAVPASACLITNQDEFCDKGHNINAN
eukprot:341292-Amphidinium_carterae.3